MDRTVTKSKFWKNYENFCCTTNYYITKNSIISFVLIKLYKHINHYIADSTFSIMQYKVMQQTLNRGWWARSEPCNFILKKYFCWKWKKYFCWKWKILLLLYIKLLISLQPQKKKAKKWGNLWKYLCYRHLFLLKGIFLTIGWISLEIRSIFRTVQSNSHDAFLPFNLYYYLFI